MIRFLRNVANLPMTLIYSHFSATIGNSFEAFKAGNKPARRLSEAEVRPTRTDEYMSLFLDFGL
ncbi:MAG: hypothetical protein ACRD9Q_01390 [Nitrososphaeraceae archaeon]